MWLKMAVASLKRHSAKIGYFKPNSVRILLDKIDSASIGNF